VEARCDGGAGEPAGWSSRSFDALISLERAWIVRSTQNVRRGEVEVGTFISADLPTASRVLEFLPTPVFIVEPGSPPRVAVSNAVGWQRLEAKPDLIDILAGAPGYYRSDRGDVYFRAPLLDGPHLIVTEVACFATLQEELGLAIGTSGRITETACWVLLGKDKDVIAEIMKITESTVSQHIHRLLDAAKVANRREFLHRFARIAARLRLAEEYADAGK